MAIAAFDSVEIATATVDSMYLTDWSEKRHSVLKQRRYCTAHLRQRKVVLRISKKEKLHNSQYVREAGNESVGTQSKIVYDPLPPPREGVRHKKLADWKVATRTLSH